VLLVLRCETLETSQIGILREQTNRAGIWGIGVLIPAGLVLYSRRARSLFPQGCPFIPAGLALYSRRAGIAAPGIQVLPGVRRRRWPGSVSPDMRAPGRDDSALTEVGCRPQAAAACKLKGNPGLARTATGGLMSMSRLSI
jgi:hypothetical protein